MNKILASTAALLLPTAAVKGAIIITHAEDPGLFSSTLQHTTSYGFDDIATGRHTNVGTPIGTYDVLEIKAVDQYGGAGNPEGSQYSVQGTNGPQETTLSLTAASGYFGLWWSAGDSHNVLEFYNGEELVARFTTETLLNAVTAAGGYHGNPTTGSLAGQNNSEPYAFVNFFGEGSTTWDRITFTNNNNSGFESDNHTVRGLTWGGYAPEVGQPMPGVPVARVEGETITVIPEPAAALLSSLGIFTLLVRRRR